MYIMETKLLKYKIEILNSKEYHSIKNEIFNNRIYEFNTNKKNPYIIDVGSHIGLSILFFKSEFPNSKIIGFEPNPNLFSVLQSNIFNNGLENVEVKNIAISNQTGKSNFFSDRTNDLWYSTGSLLPKGWSNLEDFGEYEVDCEKLSSYLNAEVDMLKIDCEGLELEILKEAGSTLENVKNIVIEYHPNVSFDKLFSLLNKYSFSLTYFQNGRLTKKPEKSKLLVIKGFRD